MKDYLNNKEREAVVLLAVFSDSVEEMCDEWGKRGNLTKEESKYLKMSKSLMNKAFNMILGRMESNTLKQLLKSAKHTTIMCVPDTQGKMIQERMKKEKDEQELVVRFDHFYNLAEMALERCTFDCGQDPGICERREIFTILGIEPYSYQECDCQFRQRHKGEGK